VPACAAAGEPAPATLPISFVYAALYILAQLSTSAGVGSAGVAAHSSAPQHQYGAGWA
jgi:hypothetical protein